MKNRFYTFEVIRPLPGVPAGTIFSVHIEAAYATIPTNTESNKENRRISSPVTYHAIRVPLGLVLQSKDFFRDVSHVES